MQPNQQQSPSQVQLCGLCRPLLTISPTRVGFPYLLWSGAGAWRGAPCRAPFHMRREGGSCCMTVNAFLPLCVALTVGCVGDRRVRCTAVTVSPWFATERVSGGCQWLVREEHISCRGHRPRRELRCGTGCDGCHCRAAESESSRTLGPFRFLNAPVVVCRNARRREG